MKQVKNFMIMCLVATIMLCMPVTAFAAEESDCLHFEGQGGSILTVTDTGGNSHTEQASSVEVTLSSNRMVMNILHDQGTVVTITGNIEILEYPMEVLNSDIRYHLTNIMINNQEYQGSLVAISFNQEYFSLETLFGGPLKWIADENSERFQMEFREMKAFRSVGCES